jgi:L-histidine Nalpha-methyltransferase
MPGSVATSALTAVVEREALAADLAAGLSREGLKEIPSRWLYDAVGSALFEAITLLPEYGLTAADERLLRRHADDIAAFTPSRVTVAELGSGSGRKTRWVLEALARRQLTTYQPIDVSTSSLDRCRLELSGLRRVRIMPLAMPYLAGLGAVAARRPRQHRLLVLFLGSTIGNFHSDEAVAFLTDVRRHLREGDALLLGADLQQDPARLRTAYDDPAGVTAAFNRNVLARINRELEGTFDPRLFDHEARWNAERQRVEMHLVSRSSQVVAIPGAGLRVAFVRGESIWTESSYKYDAAGILRLAGIAGFRPAAQWIDTVWPFSENLLLAT